MGQPKLSEADFVSLFETIGPDKLHQKLGGSLSGIYSRRERLEQKIGRQIVAPKAGYRSTRSGIAHPAHLPLDIKDGVVLVGSDCHYWPGIITTAHRGFVRFCEELRPKAVILNGDVLDGAGISRHPPIGWEDRPTLEQEIETCKERLHEIRRASPAAEHIWTLGNHDGRFETRLATVAPEYAKVHGVHLKDHFPKWAPCWSVLINGKVVVKHRWKGGDHATWNNAIRSGLTMVTGHLHKGEVRPYSDYTGIRWGCDTGTMAEPYGPQFTDYMENAPANWRSGFLVMTFCGGELLDPEFVRVRADGELVFRGKVIAV